MSLRLPDSDESGAIAILTALLMVVVLAIAALGVDISTQVNERQKLHDTIDAAAHAGAYRLPTSGTQANTDAVAFAGNNGMAGSPTVNFFCVVASLSAGVPGLVDNSQIPTTCNPLSVRAGSSPNYAWTGSRCDAKICSIPCNPAATPADACNTIKVTGTKTVPFSFAPVIGIKSGSTGAVTSVACKGSCGTVPLNPMDVVVVADRTGSMSSTDINAMITGIKGMFTVMTPSQQFVALGTIGWSSSTAAANCKSMDESSNPASSTDATGLWVPVPFSNDYLNPGTTTVNTTNSPLVQAVNCLTNSSGTGTHLASPMKAAARYLLGTDANNLGSFPARTGTIRKAIIFETDGEPNEKFTGGDPALNMSGGIGSTASNTDAACNNFKDVAANTKTAGILVVTVAFDVSSTKCSGLSGSVKLVDRLAAAASNASTGAASAADFDCSTVPGRNSENGDGDYFFCAATGTDMKKIFVTAFTQIANGIRMIALP
jgi:hypothetical protein